MREVVHSYIDRVRSAKKDFLQIDDQRKRFRFLLGQNDVLAAEFDILTQGIQSGVE